MASVHPSRLGLVPGARQQGQQQPQAENRGEHHAHPGQGRRASPSYQPYQSNHPPRQGGGNGFGYGSREGLRMSGPSGPTRSPRRGGWQNPPPRFNGPTDFEARRQERNNSTLSVWPPSPKEPFVDEEERKLQSKRHHSKSKSSRHRSSKSKRKHQKYSDSSSTESEEEERRRRRRRRREKEKEREIERESDKRKDENYDEEDEQDKEHSKRRRKRSKSENEDDEHAWIEKNTGKAAVPMPAQIQEPTSDSVPLLAVEYEDVEVGPQLPKEVQEKYDKSAFHNMLRGEGEAMAAYAESGRRIPRRGEIGLDSDTIAAFEQSGYVMSGSRHQRMNAVRLRKENQVINEAEKRAILKMQREEKLKKEGAIVSQFKEMIDENLRKQESNGQ
ncbi:uncharacterized protein L203_102121 [Cryptococcus depauperatus CBS 7841]|uniref:Uncharacterized protein n=1 Tax=Cryptococcus depauperatus CBS 7841 TaxID=1295531 RepID=A0A1E3IRD8_9TREE|nr:hypothetical protein L203_01373 [Cryptococcus depauperatus CBS 7841]